MYKLLLLVGIIFILGLSPLVSAETISAVLMNQSCSSAENYSGSITQADGTCTLAGSNVGNFIHRIPMNITGKTNNRTLILYNWSVVAGTTDNVLSIKFANSSGGSDRTYFYGIRTNDEKLFEQAETSDEIVTTTSRDNLGHELRFIFWLNTSVSMQRDGVDSQFNIELAGASENVSFLAFAGESGGTTLKWLGIAVLNGTESTLEREVPVADPCDCPDSGDNWEISSSDNCVLTTACDIGTGKVRVNDGQLRITGSASLTAFGLYVSDSASFFAEDTVGCFIED